MTGKWPKKIIFWLVQKQFPVALPVKCLVVSSSIFCRCFRTNQSSFKNVVVLVCRCCALHGAVVEDLPWLAAPTRSFTFITCYLRQFPWWKWSSSLSTRLAIFIPVFFVAFAEFRPMRLWFNRARFASQDKVDSIWFAHEGCRFASGSCDGTACIWKFEKSEWSSIALNVSETLEVSCALTPWKRRLKYFRFRFLPASDICIVLYYFAVNRNITRRRAGGNYTPGAEKSQQCRKCFLQYSTFAS